MSALVYQCTKMAVVLLYPAYVSFKAIHTKNVREYVKCMMYWIVFSLFLFVEAITDLFCYWIPFYSELKLLFIIWMIAPVTKGSSVLYRKIVHPQFVKREQDIDGYLCQVKDHGYRAIITLGARGVNLATNAVIKGSDQLRRSWSLSDLSESGGGQRRSHKRFHRTSSLPSPDSGSSSDDNERYKQELAGSQLMRRDLADSQQLEEIDREIHNLPLLRQRSLLSHRWPPESATEQSTHVVRRRRQHNKLDVGAAMREAVQDLNRLPNSAPSTDQSPTSHSPTPPATSSPPSRTSPTSSGTPPTSSSSPVVTPTVRQSPAPSMTLYRRY